MSDASAPSLVLAVLPSFSAAAGLPEDDGQKLRTVVEGLLGFALDNAYPDGEPGEVDVTLEAGEGLVQVTVHDWGRPLMSRGGAWAHELDPARPVRAAVNQEMANPDTPVKEGDEVAFFPPVTGG